MKAAQNVSRRATYAEYLAAELGSERKHEFVGGVIAAMPGGSDEHSAIGFRFSVLFGTRLSPGCFGHTADHRFWIPGAGHSRYSDGSIVFGKAAHPPHDKHATTNPAVVVEVLSPSTEDDHGDKRSDFQSLASLEAYVLVAQDARRVTVYRRSAHGAWRDEPAVYAGGERFELPRLTQPIAVDDIYDGILDATGRSLLR